MDRRWNSRFGTLLAVSTLGCFNGHDALGLSCEKDSQCGNGQVCAQGTCAWSNDTSTSSASGSSTGSSDVGADTQDSTNSTTNTGSSNDTGSADGTTSTDSGPGPTLPCVDTGVDRPIARAITVTGSGNAMAAGVGQFSDESVTDVVVLTRTPGRVSRFRFDGTAFQAIDTFDTETGPMDLAVADLDQDGFDDIVVVDETPAAPDLVVFWGDAASPFDASSSLPDMLPIPHSVDAGQMLDGPALEILVASGTMASSATLVTLQQRTLSSRFTVSGFSASPWDTVVVDLDGSGNDEALIVGSNDEGLDGFSGSDRVHVIAASNAGLTREQLEATTSPYGADAGDLDGDGLPEIVVVGKNILPQTTTMEESDQPSQIGLCSRQSPNDPLDCDVWSASLDPTNEMLTGFNNVRLADLNCDDHLDAIIGTTGGTTEPGDGTVLMALGPLRAGFQPTLLALGNVGSVGNKLALADVTDDDSPDILVPIFGDADSGTGVVQVYSFEEPAR